MPLLEATIEREVAVVRTPRVLQMAGMFDCPLEEKSRRVWEVRLDLPEDWRVGCIVGPSGCGKSTVARRLFGDRVVADWPWPEGKSVLDGFPEAMGIKEVVELLSSVGFASPPSWCKPFAVLSTGEQFRANLARTLAETPDLAVVDEFTSVVDRTVARIGSAAAAKVVRRTGRRLVAVTCHFDVLEWLQPDWMYQPATGEFQRRRLQRRPDIQLEIRRVGRSAWRLFRDHHYLNSNLHRAAKCFGAYVEGRLAAFVAVLSFPHPKRPGWREHRCVCLPDFQGVGIGHAISEFVAALYASTGKPYRSVTSHPGMIAHRRRSANWRMIRRPSLGQQQGTALRRAWAKCAAVGRLTASFEYVGPRRREEAERFGVVGSSR